MTQGRRGAGEWGSPQLSLGTQEPSNAENRKSLGCSVPKLLIGAFGMQLLKDRRLRADWRRTASSCFPEGDH